jgi:hypothetical protein
MADDTNQAASTAAAVDEDGDGDEDGGTGKLGPYLKDGKPYALNDGVIRPDGATLQNVDAVRKRLGEALRGKQYSAQRVRAIINEGWLALWRRNVSEEDEAPFYLWFIADGRGGRTDTVQAYVDAVNAGGADSPMVRAAGGSITLSKVKDGAAKIPDGYTAPDGVTLADLLAAYATSNGLRFVVRATKSAAGDQDGAAEAAAGEAPAGDQAGNGGGAPDTAPATK